MHDASRCAIEYCHCLLVFLITIVRSINGRLPAGLPLRYTFDSLQPYRKKCNGFKSGDRTLHFFESIFLNNFV